MITATTTNDDFSSRFLAPTRRHETLEYLDPNAKWGTFSVLRRRKSKAGAKPQQTSHPLYKLLEVLKECDDPQYDYWISQASFHKFNRRKANLKSVSLAFVDLDYYTIPSLSKLDPEAIVQDYLFPLLSEKRIPLPSLVIDSGRGLQIKWFVEPLPARALPRWDVLQGELVKALASIGGDSNARDASRILRIVGTTNQTSGSMVRVIWADTDKAALPTRYEFNDLCNRVLPFTQEQAQDYKRSRRTRFKAATKRTTNADKALMLKFPTAHTLENLNWNRLHDLKLLCELRGGDVGDGLREPLAFYLCNFYGLRYAQSGLDDALIWHEFQQLCQIAAPHWDYKHAISKVSNVFELLKKQSKGQMREYNGHKVPLLYVPRNDTIINLFEITDAEQSKLATVISKTEKQRRNTIAHRGEQGTSREAFLAEATSRAKTVLKLSQKGLKQAEIAAKMGISVNAVKSIKKRSKSKV